MHHWITNCYTKRMKYSKRQTDKHARNHGESKIYVVKCVLFRFGIVYPYSLPFKWKLIKWTVHFVIVIEMRKIPRIWSVQVSWKVKITWSGCVIIFVAWNILVACFFSTINRKKIHQTKFACFDFCKKFFFVFAWCVLFSIRFLCCNSKSYYVLECGQLKCLFR